LEGQGATVYTQNVDFINGTNPDTQWGGGSMYLDNTKVLLSQTRFMFNRAPANEGGAIAFWGGERSFCELVLDGVSFCTWLTRHIQHLVSCSLCLPPPAPHLHPNGMLCRCINHRQVSAHAVGSICS
jgi:hypothetical protein